MYYDKKVESYSRWIISFVLFSIFYCNNVSHLYGLRPSLLCVLKIGSVVCLGYIAYRVESLKGRVDRENFVFDIIFTSVRVSSMNRGISETSAVSGFAPLFLRRVTNLLFWPDIRVQIWFRFVRRAVRYGRLSIDFTMFSFNETYSSISPIFVRLKQLARRRSASDRPQEGFHSKQQGHGSEL